MQIEYILQAHGLVGRGGGQSAPLPTIENLSGQSNALGTQIALTWDNPAVIEVQKVQIFMVTTDISNSTYEYLSANGTKIVDSNIETYTVSGLSHNDIRYFKAFGIFNVLGEQKVSSGVSIQAQAKDTTPPNPITNFTATGDDAKVLLEWTNPSDSDFSKVRIMRKTDSYPASVSDGTLVYGGGGTSKTVTNLTNDIEYFFRAFTYDTAGNINSSASQQAKATPSELKVYGISWSGGPSTAWTRTDAAAGSSDPVPALSNGNGSSPFDNCYPWNGMVKEPRTGGVMVKIPKFWFKWTKSGSALKLQIAEKAVDGFSVSPAHMDRGDGKGERDYVYVGRYHCNSSYLSATGSSPVASITRSSARTSIHAKGSTIWQMDYAMRLTIWMLMLVEFADNDFQAKIGYGCGNNSAVGAMGYTDSMTYHTGTTQSARTTYGLGTQYRYIEGLWDNVRDWMDGCYYSSSGMSVIKNPANFSDTANGTVIGTPTSGYPSAMSLSTDSGFEWCIYPTMSSGSTTTYFPDNWNFNASNPCLYAGGYYYQSLCYGAFYVSCTNASGVGTNIGCRLQELP